MKKLAISLFTSISLLIIAFAAASHMSIATNVVAPLRDWPAFKAVTWVYNEFPARPEFLLPLIFLTAMIAIVGIAAHHLREDQRLNELSDISTRNIKRVVRRPKIRRVSGRLVPARA
ncbi:MAG TPA: hypothetical protein VIT91_13235 [Chthoniobacterales bacterium]